jgi:uncharacterized protein
LAFNANRYSFIFLELVNMNNTPAIPRHLKRFDSPTEFKFADKAGKFTGYASIFGNVDSGGDVILPNAFKEFAQTKDGKTIVLYQHSTHDPIGKATVSQDSKGLHFEAELSLNDPTAKKAYTLMQDGIIDSMSVGYDVLEGGAKSFADRRELTKLKLYEISPVTWGMNELARIETVKSALDCSNTRELEELLRDTFVISSRKAKASANALFPILAGRDAQANERDVQSGTNNDEIAAILPAIYKFRQTLKGK